MESVLDVYERPYNPENPVVCLDESPKQLISHIIAPFMTDKGIIREDYQYKREGVQDIYMVCEPLGCYREVMIEENHNRLTYAKIIQHVAEDIYPTAAKITLIEDNLSAHKLSALYEIMPPQKARAIIRRIELVRTPKHGSWLNIAECELSVLTRVGLEDRIPTKEKLIEQANQWFLNRNDKQKGVDWQFKSKDARIKLKRLYPSIQT